MYPHVPTVISICLTYLTYDPNYNYDDEDEDENAMDADGADEDYQGTGSAVGRAALSRVFRQIILLHRQPAPALCSRVSNLPQFELRPLSHSVVPSDRRLTSRLNAKASLAKGSGVILNLRFASPVCVVTVT